MIAVSLFVIDIVLPYILFSLRSRLNAKFMANKAAAMLCYHVLIVALAHVVASAHVLSLIHI